MTYGLETLLKALRDAGYSPDQSQKELLYKLVPYLDAVNAGRRNKHMLSWLGFKKRALSKHIKSGVYIWGDVGRGKSMILDIFHSCLGTTQKKRAHFHEFMLDVHSSLEALRKDPSVKDQILKLAADLAEKYHVIILDELQVNNIADAMIVGRLFDALIKDGVLVFFSSNRIPDDLFKDGLQRELFLPFIKLVKEKLEVQNLDNAVDYRMEKLDVKSTYFYPINKKTENSINSIISKMIGEHELAPMDIEINQNRYFHAFKAYGKVAVFTFRELCETELSALDYIAICKVFKVVVIRNIPKLSYENHNELLRFITLIDCMYENKTKLICSAEVDVDELYNTGKHAFEFHRTVSRLIEMRSNKYFEDSGEHDAKQASSMMG